MPDKASILIVDDRPEKILAIEAVLEDLGQTIVRAHSGRDALRQVLNREFAVILLDVNMPGMDGFETASLIRQRRISQHIPIIFITAFGDEMHASRGYSLGAVDYILAPVIPDVLRTKVTVFVDLFRKNQQLKRQADSLHQRATQLHKLTQASLAINSALSIDQLMKVMTETARDIVGTSHARSMVLPDPSGFKPLNCASSSDDECGSNEGSEFADLIEVVCRENRVLRIAQADLDNRLRDQVQGLPPAKHTMLNGWLGVPFSGRDGRNMGLVHLSDKLDGSEFTEDDEAMLVQLAQMASIAIENTIFAQEREANRLKDEFLATLSHELRTPLNAMLGWSQILRMENTEGDLAHGLEVIERNVRAQSKLVDDLLDVSRITSGKFRLNTRLTSLVPIVKAAIDSVRPVADARGIAVGASLASDADTIGDPDRLQQVVWNLLSNAIKFTPEGGKVDVTLDVAGSEAEIRVADTGQGINKHLLPHVFDRFRQGDSSSTRHHGGLGIGLAIVRHITELHGGSVQASSEGDGRGSTFIVRLPLHALRERPAATAPPPAATLTAAAPLPAGQPLTGLCVLVVDDHADARELLSEILGRAGAEVLAASSAAEAFKQLTARKPHVMISDIAMPDEDGYSLIRRVRELGADQGGQIPAVAVTAHAREEDRMRSLAAGFQEHLSKPLHAGDLIALLQSHRTARASRPETTLQLRLAQ